MIALSAIAGAGLAALYLALLWAGTRALAGLRPARVFVGLALARAALVVAALAGWAALGASGAALLAGLAGFLAVRLAATRAARAGGTTWR